MLDFYLAEVRRARTDNLIHRVHHSFENELAPAEFEQLAHAIETSGVEVPPVCHAWIAHTRRLLQFGSPGMRPFMRQPVAPGVTLYTAPPAMDTDDRRTLVVAFAGDALRLMLPISAFLQYLDPARYELLLLFDKSLSMFMRGIPEVASGVGPMLSWLEELRRARAATRTIALGTSSGGLAAVWTAVALGLDRAVSVGGTTPAEVAERHQTLDLDISGFDDAIRRRAGALPEVVYLFGELWEPDRRKGESLAGHLPVTMVPVPRSAQHNVIFDAMRRGTLPALLELLLGERNVAKTMRDPAVRGWAA